MDYTIDHLGVQHPPLVHVNDTIILLQYNETVLMFLSELIFDY